MHHKALIVLTVLATLVTLPGCQKEVHIPQKYEYAKDTLTIFPDYKNITIPVNIAPMNFIVRCNAKAIVAEVCAGKQTVVISANSENEICFEEQEWKELLKEEHGKGITFHIFAKTESGWIRYQDFKMNVAPESIDSYVSYRLIEPGYELYRQMGLYQRNLETFDIKTIYENNRVHDTENNHCVNCHNYQNYSTENMLFHVRSAHGGTIICSKELIEKKELKLDSILGPAVYPSWHPTMKRIAFSSNMTGQSFHILDKEKVEVIDGASDLVYYNVENNTIQNILKTKTDLETFPCWNPQGNKLYYCVAHVPQLDTLTQDESYLFFLNHYKDVKYNIMSLDFDAQKESFSNPQLVVDCAAEGKSASVPRISPDGKYLLFTKGDYGQFHIWHKSSDLWVKNLQDSTSYALSAANSKDVDSYHCWSSNGRWIIFSSRRDDSNFTRLYIAYFDKRGKAHKAFMLPQKSPQDNTLLLKSYNVPELTKDALRFDENSFKEIIYKSKAQPANFKS